MSRIGRTPVTVPSGVNVTVNPDHVVVKGPKGELTVPVSRRLEINIENEELNVTRPSDHREDRAQHGLARSLINNAVTGVTDGFTRNLEIRGVGYRAQMRGQDIELSLGFSHPVIIEAPEGITINTPDQTHITISGIDKQLVGQVAANIRAIRPPDSYHGKGVRYEGEQVRLKAGKTAAR